MSQSNLLIYDDQTSGHRGNYVRLFSSLTGGRALVAPFVRSFAALLKARYLIFPTFEGAPRRNLIILLLRILMGRKTVIILLRVHLYEHRGVRSRIFHRVLLALINRSSSVLALSIVESQALKKRCPSIEFITDPEFWDLTVQGQGATLADLGRDIRRLAGTRKILIIAGTISQDKAVDRLAEAWSMAPGLREQVFPVAAGKVMPGMAPTLQFIKNEGLLVDRTLSDAEFNSLFAVADFAWCAYRPDRDMSSGILGRCIQTRVIPVVRKGSIAARLAEEWTQPLIVDFSALHALGTELSKPQVGKPAEIPQARLEAEGRKVISKLAEFFDIPARGRVCAGK